MKHSALDAERCVFDGGDTRPRLGNGSRYFVVLPAIALLQAEHSS